MNGQPENRGPVSSPSRPSSRHLKDVAIGLAIFILVVLLWKLMTHPERFGTAGPWLKTNVFGASGIGLAGPFGSSSAPGTSPSQDSGGSSPVSEASNRLAGSASTSAPVAADAAGKLNDSSLSNNLITIIADYSEESPATNRLGASPGPALAPQEAAALAGRLRAAGAKSGDIQFSLFWKNHNDLDLHCVDPTGIEIYYSNKRSTLTGGELDIDQNFTPPYGSAPIENIYWPAGGAPKGIYKVFVVYYAQHDRVDPTPYTVRTVVGDKTRFFTNTIIFAGQRKSHWICTVQYDPTNPDPAYRCRFLPYR